MAQTRKQREAEQAQVQKMLALLLVAGLLLLLWRPLWGILLLGGAVALILLVRRGSGKHKRTLLDLGVSDLGALSWGQLEELVLLVLRKRGFTARLTPNGADFGADILAEKTRTKTAVQVKHWNRRDVGVTAVQEVVGSKAHYGATAALVVTTGYFTAQAIQLAKSNRVELWDRPRLERELGDLSRQPGVSRVASSNAMPTPAPAVQPAFAAVSCPRCGSPMLERDGMRGRFLGCSTFPRCRGTLPL